MKPMVINIFRYLKIFFLLVKVNYLKALEYRVDFFSAILPTGMYSLAFITFVYSVMSKTSSIYGWNFDQMLVLFATEQLFYYTGWMFYRRSINTFSTLIRNGTMDMILKTPVNSRFLASFRDQSPEIIIPISGAVAVLFYAARNIALTPGNIILFIIFIIIGVILLYNVLFTMASLSFWTTEADEFVQFTDEILSFGRYPLQIFPGFIGILLLTVIPAILMVYVPATALIGILDLKMIPLSITVLVLTTIVSQKIWHLGLRHYSSASS